MDDQPPSNQPPTPPPAPPVAASPPPPSVAPPPIITSASLPPRRSGCSVVWKILTFVLLGVICLMIFGRIVSISTRATMMTRGRNVSDRGRTLEEVTIQQTNSDNKIAVITVDGIITSGEMDRANMTMPDFIAEQLKNAERDSDVKAVILKVNSPGGEVLASDDINRAIRKFQDKSHKPVVVSMGTLAASGGYYISAPCRWIVANELTITGSIGVIMDSWNYRLLMDKVGIRPHVFKSGRFKDMLSGEREPDTDKLSPQEQKNREEEEKMVQGLIDETYNRFKEVVRTGRNHAADQNEGKGKALADNWQDYADGRVLSGKEAMGLGFVDELGDFDVAVHRTENLANITSASLVEYHVAFDFQSVLSHMFSKSDTPALKVDLGLGLPLLKAGHPYYILPTAVLH
jgi:protease IV